MNDAGSPSLRRNVSSLLVSQAMTWTLATALNFAQPRLLSVADLGRLRVAASIWAIAEVVCTMGTSTLLTLAIAREPQGAWNLVARVLRVRLFAYGLSWVPVGAMLAFSGFDRSTLVVAVLVGIATIGTLGASAFRSALLGLQEMASVGRADVVTKLSTVAVLIPVMLFHGTATAVSIASVGLAIVASLVMFVEFRRHAADRRLPVAASLRVARASRGYLLSDILIVCYAQVDIFAMAYLATQTEIGWYAIAAVVFSSILFIPTILTTVLFPAIAELEGKDDERVSDLLHRTLSAMIVVAVPIGLGTWVVSDSFIQLIGGSKAAPAGPLLAIFGAVSVASSGTIILGRFAMALGLVSFWNTLLVVGTLGSIPLDIVLIPWAHREFGNAGIGGGLAFCVTELFMLVAGLIRLRRRLQFGVLFRRLVRVLLAAGAMWLASWPLREFVFVLPAAVGALVYGIGIELTRALTSDERALVTSLARRLPKLRR